MQKETSFLLNVQVILQYTLNVHFIVDIFAAINTLEPFLNWHFNVIYFINASLRIVQGLGSYNDYSKYVLMCCSLE